MADVRSEFVHLWVIGGDLTADELRSALGELEHAARTAPPRDGEPGTEEAASPGALPLPVRQFLAGLAFLRDHLWSGGEAGPPALAGFLLHGDRLWALRAGRPATLDQMTGAPARIPWHEPDGESGLAWCEVDAAEVWRLEVAVAGGTLSAHARPPLASVLGTMRDEAMSDSSTPVVPAPELPPAAGTAAEPEPSFVAPRPAAAPAPPVPRPRPRLEVVPRAPASSPVPMPGWLPPRVAFGLAAGLAVAALVAITVSAREPLSRVLVGRYDLALTTSPAGATVRVDGRLVAGRTPLTVALEPGEHRVELAYGDYANAVITVDGARDETIRRAFTWTGSLAVSSADTTVRLRVAFDGEPWGRVPLWRDDVPVGRHRLSFQGEGVRPWEEEVQVKSGQSTRVVAEPVRVPDYGLVTARAERVSHEGIEDVEGAAVFVDGKPAGQTPVDLRLSPGPHSVRILAGPEAGPVHLIDVQPGGRFYASTTFGRPPEPAVVFDPPRTISRAAPPTLVVRLQSDVPLPVRRMRLFLRRPGGSGFAPVELALTRDGGRARGTIRFPVHGLAAGATARYYVAIETREGEEYFSEVRAATVLP